MKRAALCVLILVATLFTALSTAQAQTVKDELIYQSELTIGYEYAHNSATDPQFFQAGVWNYANAACFPCQDGPASLSAAIFAVTQNTAYLSLSSATVAASIAAHKNADGSLGDETTPDPIFFLDEIGFSCWETLAAVTPTQRTLCQETMRRGADWLISSGNANWYANGNIVAAQVAVFLWAYRVTQDAKYLTQYNTELAFLQNPPQVGNNIGFGLHLTSPTTGYLAERGAGGTGYDGDYTQLSLSTLARVYAVNHDPAILNLCNLLFNTLWSHTNPLTFVLDASGGTRHSLQEPLWTGAMGVLAYQGGRADLMPLLSAQLETATYPTFVGNASQNWGNPGLYRDQGIDLGALLLAIAP